MSRIQRHSILQRHHFHSYKCSHCLNFVNFSAFAKLCFSMTNKSPSLFDLSRHQWINWREGLIGWCYNWECSSKARLKERKSGSIMRLNFYRRFILDSIGYGLGLPILVNYEFSKYYFQYCIGLVCVVCAATSEHLAWMMGSAPRRHCSVASRALHFRLQAFICYLPQSTHRPC